MSQYDWYTLLTQWSKETLESEDSKYFELPPDTVESGWLGYPGATDEQIVTAEARLDCTLPPSYREFLKVTNGWRNTSISVNKLWSTEMIDWHYTRHTSTVDMWIEGEAWAERNGWSLLDKEYNVYGEAQTSMVRGQHFKATLEIGQYIDDMYLLNPLTISVDGEWEAWHFAHWIPGARRYQSFWDLIQNEYQNIRRAK